MLEDREIKLLLQNFHKSLPFLQTDRLIDFFTFFGGSEEFVQIDAFESIERNIETRIIERIAEILQVLSPSYIVEEPYRRLLVSIARGDGRMFSLFRKARISEAAGGDLIRELADRGVIYIEESRELPRERIKGEKLPKELRRYRIQPKVRFVLPFYRFWFGFVEPYRKEIEYGKKDRFWENFYRHKDRAQSLIFEQLSNELLIDMYAASDPIVSYGSWWDRTSEYDLLAFTKSGKVILGECKYKGRKITRAELTKLQDKAQKSGIRCDVFVLFSKNGFSNELLGAQSKEFLLKDIGDFVNLL